MLKHLAPKELVKIYDGEASTVLSILERCVRTGSTNLVSNFDIMSSARYDWRATATSPNVLEVASALS